MDDFTGYLFVYFTGEQVDGEQVYFSVSDDGLHWKDLNNGKPALRSEVGEKGVRDPFIIRSVDGSKYYIIATDLRIEAGKGWGVAQYEGSKSLVVWESDDLIHWSKEQLVEVGVKEAGCVWAPEAIYNEKTKDYLVFWASMVKEEGDENPKQRIYCSSTKDFGHFSKAIKYIERENHIIDTTIIKDKGVYYRISKDETTKNIKIDQGTDLLDGPFTAVKAPQLEKINGVEGPAAFLLNGTDQWCLMVDQFATNGGYMPLISENLARGEFRVLEPDTYDLGSTKKRHGSILNLTIQEYQRLLEKYS
jgi:hypothetical protein